MRLNIIGVVILALSVLLGFSSTALAKEPPVAKLVQVNGNVEYSRMGLLGALSEEQNICLTVIKSEQVTTAQVN